jgi:hypothetical protein
MSDLRPSPIAGTWYPGDRERLRQSVDQQLQAADVDPPAGEIIGLIAPHAGHRYSGQVAAYAFRCLEGASFDVVAVLSPLHQPYPGQVVTSEHAAYGTPLGEVQVDHELLEELQSRLGGEPALTRVRDDQEHSVEIELPFLQRVLSQPFKLLPLMLRDQSPALCERLGGALAALLADREALLIASSDLSHFYPASTAHRLDRRILDRIEAFDPQGVLAAEREGVGFACGRGAVATVLWASRALGATHARVLRYAHSGDVTGDLHAVVGYAAGVLYRAGAG